MSKETLKSVWESLLYRWEKYHLPKGLLQVENNFNVLKSRLEEAINQNVKPTMENWQAIVQQATTDGRLQYDTPKPVEPPPFVPEDNLPHPNEPKLRNICNLEDLNEMSAEQAKVFVQPAAFDTGLNQKFSERASYIRQHRIRRKKTEKVQPEAQYTPKKPTRVYMLTPEQAKIAKAEAECNQSCIDEANSIIANHMGRTHSRTAGERQILIGVRDAAIKAGKSAKEVLEAVKAKWNTYSSNSSAR